MTIPFTCPHCGHHTEVNVQYAGRTGPCVSCANTITIPSPEAVSATARPRSKPQDRPWWIKSGMILGVVVAIGVLGFAGFALLKPAFEVAREAARCSACDANLRRIGMAIEDYYSQEGHYPPAVVYDVQGKPMHSWRVLILPYLGPDAQAVHDLYDMSEPWDGPKNSLLSGQIPQVYQCPSDIRAARGETSYLAVVGPETLINSQTAVTRDAVRDVFSDTLVIIESASSTMDWLKPRDITVDQLRAGLNSRNASSPGSNHPQGVNALMADGSVSCLPNTITAQELRGMSTIAGEEYIETLDELGY